MTCPRCGFALVAYMGHDTCSLGCGYDGPTRAPTAEERGYYGMRRQGAKLRGNPGPRSRKVA